MTNDAKRGNCYLNKRIKQALYMVYLRIGPKSEQGFSRIFKASTMLSF